MSRTQVRGGSEKKAAPMRLPTYCHGDIIEHAQVGSSSGKTFPDPSRRILAFVAWISDAADGATISFVVIVVCFYFCPSA